MGAARVWCVVGGGRRRPGKQGKEGTARELLGGSRHLRRGPSTERYFIGSIRNFRGEAVSVRDFSAEIFSKDSPKTEDQIMKSADSILTADADKQKKNPKVVNHSLNLLHARWFICLDATSKRKAYLLG